ncbi:hypothetical protein HZS_3836 [Henneguya salminicola]|nr:hypothetical protein HZS_3836 [Henneguya salminicola]
MTAHLSWPVSITRSSIHVAFAPNNANIKNLNKNHLIRIYSESNHLIENDKGTKFYNDFSDKLN